ncbi:ABC transporter ATP-binding protein/permease [Tabrizicola sp. J26]|uniref:ABC transporter ATP-binding protein n=1 Tax=Alitabrizicola rongguiensis TaxID=2909234 RepID=UPI001F206BBD|nr:ABC transporter ATP-binding protein [Tabrizicola rongguiensis]MCF1709479.1 ABC transporter ATP-binding protein/permease [Tabrizicola rongguiensis]
MALKLTEKLAYVFPIIREEQLWRLLRENIRAQRHLYIIAVLAMIVVAGMTSATAWIMRYIVDAMTIPDNRGMVFLVAGAVALIFTLKGLATYVQSVALTRAGNRIVATQQIKLYDKLLRQGVSFFNLTESSDLLMRVTQSANAARSIIDIIVTSFVRDLLTLIGLVTVMFWQQPLLSMVSLVFGPLAILGIRILLRKVRAIMEQEMASLAEIIKVIQETSTGIRIIKAFALEDRMAFRMNKAVREVEKRSNAIARLEAITSPLMDTLSGFAIAAVVALSAVQAFGQSNSSPGQLMSFVTALLMAYEPAKRLSRMRVSIESGMVGVRMMFGLLDQPETLTQHPEALHLAKGEGRISFDQVSFDYGNGRPVLNNISLAFEAGKTTALVGPSGGGKSTILNLILRLYDPRNGTVRIDGHDIRLATFASLRDLISYVGQDTFLFSASVAENIRFGRPDATVEEIVAACKSANAHEFIEKLPKGYDTQVGENGAFLSGGQKQRLAIARAMLRNAPILLLDEATSALDSRSEALVQEALQHLTQGRTTVVIAHRLSTVLNADKICVIENGRLSEEGSIDALLAREGTFRALYDQQFGGAERRNSA